MLIVVCLMMLRLMMVVNQWYKLYDKAVADVVVGEADRTTKRIFLADMRFICVIHITHLEKTRTAAKVFVTTTIAM